MSCDREADFFEMFDEQRRDRCVELLVRAKHNRNIAEEPFKLWEAVRQMPAQSQVRVQIPAPECPAEEKQTACPAVSAWTECGSGGALYACPTLSGTLPRRQSSDGYLGDSCAGGKSAAEHRSD